MTDPVRPAANPVVKLFGAFLIAVGGLIAALSGLCSLAFLGTAVLNVARNPHQAGGIVMIVPLILLFGGVPFAFGGGLIVAGLAFYRR